METHVFALCHDRTLKILVLDEADLMFSFGYEEDARNSQRNPIIRILLEDNWTAFGA